jgi:hypothetical protein
MLKPGPAFLELRKLLLAEAQMGLCVLQHQYAALTPNRIDAKIGYDRHGYGRKDQKAEKAGNRTPDSHFPNESHADSRRQAEFD